MGFRASNQRNNSLPHDGEASQVVTSPASLEPPDPPGRLKSAWLRWTSPYVTSGYLTEYEICERR